MIHKFILFLLILFCVTSNLKSQSKDPDLILERVKEAFNKIEDYEVDIHLKIDVEFLKMPESDAKLFFKYPDKLHVESEKFALLPRRGLNFSPSNLISEKYTAIYEREDTIRNITVSVVKVIPIGNDNNVILSTFWIDQSRDLILKVESSRKPYGTFTIELTYDLYDDQYELPSYLEFTFTVDPSMLKRQRDMDMNQDKPEQKEKGETKTGKVFISYSNYKVNTGLPDELFEDNQNKSEPEE